MIQLGTCQPFRLTPAQFHTNFYWSFVPWHIKWQHYHKRDQALSIFSWLPYSTMHSSVFIIQSILLHSTKRYYRLDATDLGTPWTSVPLCTRARLARIVAGSNPGRLAACCFTRLFSLTLGRTHSHIAEYQNANDLTSKDMAITDLV